jgi:hypothetical protein
LTAEQQKLRTEIIKERADRKKQFTEIKTLMEKKKA